MPENPEQARAQLVSRLRGDADDLAASRGSLDIATDLRQAANEIEDLSKLVNMKPLVIGGMDTITDEMMVEQVMTYSTENFILALRNTSEMNSGYLPASLCAALERAADEIETIDKTDKIGKTAKEVWSVAAKKGMLFVTDPKTRSDKLIGFFVPAEAMNNLGNALR